MATARITTDTDGRLTPESTATLNGRTVPIPERTEAWGRTESALRVIEALRELTVRPATNYFDDLEHHHAEGYFTVTVVQI